MMVKSSWWICVACMPFTLFIVLNKSLKGDEEETAEVTEAETATEEAGAVAAAEPAAQDESAGVSPETGGETDLLAPDASPAVEEAQQEAAANLEVTTNSEAAAVQG